MSKTTYIRPKSLGDLRAEADTEMLSRAFLETADYRTLIETSDRIIVVGRRGTGKSALTLHMQKYWQGDEHTHIVKIVPEEHQAIGLRPPAALFGNTFSKTKAGSRLVWRYALMMEVALRLSTTYKFSKTQGYKFLSDRARSWESSGAGIVDRFTTILRAAVKDGASAEERIGNLSVSLDLTNVERALAGAIDETKEKVVFLIDRLDEGYEPDDLGTGLVDGLVHAAIDLKTNVPNIKSIVFLRDNIFRAIQGSDANYSRNIEGSVLRLHWDVQSLLNFVTKRMKIAFDVQHESALRVWNHCSGGDLKGRSGFELCLQLTLYRPRDLLSLLNQAFYLAGSAGQAEIVREHIERAGEEISRNRLNDLRREYEAILPGLSGLVSAFHGQNPEMEVATANRILEERLDNGSENALIQQDFFILDNAHAALRALYSIGFLGVRDASSGTFVFSHDGREPDRTFADVDRVLVHPCYWMALNCSRNALGPGEAEQIYDEYDIAVSSETPAIRNARIRGLVAELDTIDEGQNGATGFEQWCFRAIRICFAKGLRNVELKPNRNARLRRDIVATNLGEGDAWRRIYEDYGARQVIFEVKNYKGLEAADYQQVQSYLSGDYGRLAFVINRDDSENLYAGKDVEWVRDLYANHKVLVIKLTAKFLSKLLDKLRNPQKHDAVNDSVHRLLDTYSRLYIAGEGKSETPRKRKRKPKRPRTDVGR